MSILNWKKQLKRKKFAKSPIKAVSSLLVSNNKNKTSTIQKWERSKLLLDFHQLLTKFL